ncbi:MAG: GDSL-type esterase/lipase family protein [Desulfovibrio sp.]|jgi:lysophospholipase L1-like esterase|nr:GDSL-type esterase/lipase family protein [Desulfovibrio sp.]
MFFKGKVARKLRALQALVGALAFFSVLFASCVKPPPEEFPAYPPRALEGTKAERFDGLRAQARAVRSCAVLLIGDSLVEGFYKTYHGAGIFAAGVQGAGVRDWLGQAPALLGLLKTGRIILALGVNDSRIPAEKLPEFFRDYEALCRIAGAAAPLSLSTILPVRRGKGRATRFGNRINPGMIRRMNEGIARIAAAEGYELIDSHRAMADAYGMLSEDLTVDGVHLTRAGYAKWEAALFPGYSADAQGG